MKEPKQVVQLAFFDVSWEASDEDGPDFIRMGGWRVASIRRSISTRGVMAAGRCIAAGGRVAAGRIAARRSIAAGRRLAIARCAIRI